MNSTLATPEELKAWNAAHDRLMQYLETFALGDHAHVSRLALNLLELARETHQRDPSRNPTAVTMEQAQKLISEWLAKNLHEEGDSPSKIQATGYVALLLSGLYRVAPTAFLEYPVPEDLRRSMQQTLLVTGPDLNVSSMTPRHLDYGPMLNLARQTWHRWDAKTIAIALAFWAGVYTILFFWLSEAA